MNYEEMSDSKIAMCVAMKIEGVTYNESGEPDFAKDCFSETQSTHARVCWVGCDGEYVNFDPCNNPSDSWPIIVDNRISLIRDIYTWDAHSGLIVTVDIHGKETIAYDKCAFDDNPLRAAMICFLKMQNS